MFVSPQNSYVKTLTSNVIVFGGGAFEMQWGLDEFMKVGLSWYG